MPEEHTTLKKAFKYRLYPTLPQRRDLGHARAYLERTLSLCRDLYNAALQERRAAYRKGKRITFHEQKRWLPQIRAELPEYKRVHSQVLQNVIERVDRAFKGFFMRVQRGQKPGYPRFKGKGRYDSFTFPQAGTTGVKVQKGGKRVLISVFPSGSNHGIGSVKVKLHRPLEGKIKTATVKREGEQERGSRRREQAKRRVAKLHRKIAHQRKDFHHKIARRLVNEYGTIAHEDLNVIGLARTPVAKGVQDAGWAQFLQILAYKAAAASPLGEHQGAGRRVVGVDPRYTSQDCPVCGHGKSAPCGCGSTPVRGVGHT